jgi:hypothetical protein
MAKYCMDVGTETTSKAAPEVSHGHQWAGRHPRPLPRSREETNCSFPNFYHFPRTPEIGAHVNLNVVNGICLTAFSLATTSPTWDGKRLEKQAFIQHPVMRHLGQRNLRSHFMISAVILENENLTSVLLRTSSRTSS